MPRGLPFAVDTWGPSSRRRRHRFLTHAHRDHLVAAGGAADSGECPGAVYATRLTLDLALRHFPRVKLPPPDSRKPILFPCGGGGCRANRMVARGVAA